MLIRRTEGINIDYISTCMLESDVAQSGKQPHYFLFLGVNV